MNNCLLFIFGSIFCYCKVYCAKSNQTDEEEKGRTLDGIHNGGTRISKEVHTYNIYIYIYIYIIYLSCLTYSSISFVSFFVSQKNQNYVETPKCF